MSLPAHLAHAYRRSRYSVAGFGLTVGRRSGALDGLLSGMGAREAVLITAWNPRSRRMPPGWNARMQRRLRQAVRRYFILTASGGARGWTEDHLLVLMPAAQAVVLARRFNQNAIVMMRRGQPAYLNPT